MLKTTLVNRTSLTNNLKHLDSEEKKEKTESMNFQIQGVSLRLSLIEIKVQKNLQCEMKLASLAVLSLKANQFQ